MDVTMGSAKERVIELAAFAEPMAAGNPGEASVVSRSVELLKDVSVTLEIRLGEASVSVQDLFSLKDGSVVELQRMVDDPVDVLLNGRVVARGQLVASGDQFGVRLTEILAGET
jgi:flagellar motor switch protein FliN/FliY